MARGDGEDLYDHLHKIQVCFLARELSFSHPRVTDWYHRWCNSTGWKGHPWPPEALKALAIRLRPPTFKEQVMYWKAVR